MPVDAEAVEGGNILLPGDGTCTVLSGDELAEAKRIGSEMHKSHFATCPNAKDFRKKGT